MVNLAGGDIALNIKDIQSGIAAGVELLLTQPSNMCASTRITSGRVTKSNRIIAATGREITFMHTLRVTAARSWSGPGIKNPSINSDGHAVFGFNLIDPVPAGSDLFGWINNLDALIKDYDIGFEETQVCTENTGTTQEASDKNFSNSSIKEALNNEASEKGDQNPAHNEGACGAKLHGIVHAPSLPQLDVNVDSKQAEVLQ